jgi:sugar diacid utilization regulator/GAF domain-containing protein
VAAGQSRLNDGVGPIRAERRLIELLAGDAPADELRAQIRELRRDLPADVAEALIDAAESLRGAIDEERRHGRAIAALNDTAADLAALRDVDAVLTAICRRARALLGTDAAYVTLGDHERGDTYVRTTDGIVSEAFRRLRLPTGVGLGGLVAARAVPIATDNYLDDERFRHVAEVDACVLGEGLLAIVGVPLRRGDDVLGVLLTGSRSTRHFTPAEVALFQALATHAAIAIENARLFAAAAESYAQLEAANASITRHNRRMEAAAALHEQLAQLAVEGGGPVEVIEALGHAVGGALELVDAEGTTVARCNDGPPPAPPIAIGIDAGADSLGTLRWWPAGDGDPGDEAELLQRSALILASQLLARRARSDADIRERAQFVVKLLEGGHTEARDLERDAARLGVALDTPHVVVVAELASEPTRWMLLKAGHAAAEAGGAASVHGRGVVAVLGAEDSGVVARRWLDLLTPAGGARPTLGVSRPACGVDALREGRAEAAGVVAVLHALDRTGVGATSEELGVFGIVFSRTDPDELRRLLRRVLDPILAYDQRRRDGQLLATALAYFEQAGHLSNTARALGIHINTLYARVERLDGLLGSDWRHADRRLELQLALRLHVLAERLGRGD